MLPGIGWTELLLIAAVAIIVVGPKELPFLMRKVGRFMGQARAMAREFQDSFEDIAREAELDELRKKARETTSNIENAINPLSPEDESDLIAAHNKAVLDKERAAMEAEPLTEPAVDPQSDSQSDPLSPGGAKEAMWNVQPGQ